MYFSPTACHMHSPSASPLAILYDKCQSRNSALWSLLQSPLTCCVLKPSAFRRIAFLNAAIKPNVRNQISHAHKTQFFFNLDLMLYSSCKDKNYGKTGSRFPPNCHTCLVPTAAALRLQSVMPREGQPDNPIRF